MDSVEQAKLEGAAEERARFNTIWSSPERVGREDLALQLINMPADKMAAQDAVAALQKAPKLTAPAEVQVEVPGFEEPKLTREEELFAAGAESARFLLGKIGAPVSA